MIENDKIIARSVALARRFVEGALGGADPDAFADIVHPDIVVETGLKPVGTVAGAAEYGRLLADTLGAAFADARMQILDVAPLVDGRVIICFEAAADNVGALNGIAATGLRFTFRELHLVRFNDAGKLVENLVGALNPLMYEMWQAPVTARELLRQP
jgi:hypothetical protein